MASLEERAAKWLSQNPDIEAKEGDVLINGQPYQYVGTSEQSQTNRGDCACECEDCIIEGEEDYCCGFTNQDATNPSHYTSLSPQPIEVIEAWGLGYHEATALKYLSRWRNKAGVEDLKKCRWFIDRLISIEEDK